MATQLVAQAPLLVTRTMKTVARRPEVLDVEGLHCCQEIVVRTLRETWGSQGGGVTSGTRAGVIKRCHWPARVVCWRGVKGTKDYASVGITLRKSVCHIGDGLKTKQVERVTTCHNSLLYIRVNFSHNEVHSET